jgi:RimJ/RimL family protein N-acetyltransferase
MTIPLNPRGLIEAPDLLETERLLLRQFLEQDVDLYARMCADPEVMRFVGEGRTLSREEVWRSVAGALGHWVLRGYGLYAVEEKATGTFIGRIGLINPEGWPGLEAGWLLGRQHWGQGYATEGARAVVRMAYEALAATHVISLIRPENLASIRIAEKLGAIRESTIELLGGRAHIYAYGGPPIDPTLLLRAPAS